MTILIGFNEKQFRQLTKLCKGVEGVYFWDTTTKVKTKKNEITVVVNNLTNKKK